MPARGMPSDMRRIPSITTRQELAALNEDQRSAAETAGNVVVLAGPGSGKTRVLVSRIATAIETSDVRRGVAAITYTNAAAEELVKRLQRLGHRTGRRLRVGTLHSFCLRDILIAHEGLLGESFSDAHLVLNDSEADRLREACYEAHGFFEKYPDAGLFVRIRRDLAVGKGMDGYDPARVAAVEEFGERLRERGAFDYEEIVIRALRALGEHASVLRLVAARFPRIAIDEYQDLGPVLHQMVLCLLDAGVEIFAVGDPNQSVMGFTGADPRYLLELGERENFTRLTLRVNYRSGQALVAASSSLIPLEREQGIAHRQESGVVVEVPVSGGQADHASQVVVQVQSLLGLGLQPGEIAVLYRGKGMILTAILAALEASDIPFVHERDQRLPKGPLATFIQKCAARASLRSYEVSHPDMADLTIPALADVLVRIAGQKHRDYRRSVVRRLASFFRSPSRDAAMASDFVAKLSRVLDLEDVAALSVEDRDIQELMVLLNSAGLSTAALVALVRPNAVVLTTYQSAKGREFAAVVLPGLIEGQVPKWASSGPPEWKLVEPGPGEVDQERRAFYVAVTRAQDHLVLITGDGWVNNGGYWQGQGLGRSRFVDELLGLK